MFRKASPCSRIEWGQRNGKTASVSHHFHETVSVPQAAWSLRPEGSIEPSLLQRVTKSEMFSTGGNIEMKFHWMPCFSSVLMHFYCLQPLGLPSHRPTAPVGGGHRLMKFIVISIT